MKWQEEGVLLVDLAARHPLLSVDSPTKPDIEHSLETICREIKEIQGLERFSRIRVVMNEAPECVPRKDKNWYASQEKALLSKL
jgi:hypothetical protein